MKPFIITISLLASFPLLSACTTSKIIPQSQPNITAISTSDTSTIAKSASDSVVLPPYLGYDLRALQATSTNIIETNAGIKKFFNSIGETVTAITVGDINRNGQKDFLVQAVDQNCGSCHIKPLYIVESGKIVFIYQGDDYEVLSAKNNQITIREPIRVDGEAMCCPTHFEITVFNCPRVESGAFCSIESQYPEKTKTGNQ